MADNTTNTPTTPDPPANKNMFTNKIAMTIIVVSGAILAGLIVMIWTHLKADVGTDPAAFKVYGNAKDVLNILLPVIGTWMGTILAFYFSKDNFEAANQQVKAILNQVNPADQKLKDLKVAGVMVKADDGMLLKVKDQQTFEEMKLSDLVQKLIETNSERMPILKSDDLTFLFLIYRTTIERFQLQFGTLTTDADHPLPADKSGLTVGHLLHSNFDLIKKIEAINLDKCFLPITATLSDARQAMQDNSLCQDVFITKTGKKTERVEGWITNTTVIEKSELFARAGNS